MEDYIIAGLVIGAIFFFACGTLVGWLGGYAHSSFDDSLDEYCEELGAEHIFMTSPVEANSCMYVENGTVHVILINESEVRRKNG